MIIVDVETTGSNPVKNSILSIGAIDFENPKEQFYQECRMWEGAHVEQEALAVNGYSEAEIKDPAKQSEGELVGNFFAWLKKRNSELVGGQNPMFDLGFIQAGAYRNHLDFLMAHRSVDLHTVVFMHMIKNGITPPTKNKKSDINSDGIMKYVGIPTEPKPHIAINGAVWEAEALSRLLYDKNLLPQFAAYSLPWKK